MFYGEYRHSIDEKKRMTIPSDFREGLSDHVVLSKGIEPCLWLYPKAVWDQMAEQIRQLPRTQPEAREFRRQLFASARPDTPDRQGRVTLPDFLLEYANINNQAVIIGQCDYCEIWNPEDWRQRLAGSDPDKRAEMFAKLGI